MKSIFSLLNRQIILAMAFSVLPLTSIAQETVYAASFAQFDERARAGNWSSVSVVFFGGSLTWGEGASDPERTSFRALLQKYLENNYPATQFNFHTAAIGGTGSKLGMFRVGRDVLARKPDLVFMDFTVADNLEGTDRHTLASYERILRDLISEGIPVVQILVGTKNHFGPDWKHLGPPRFRDHLEMASLYRTGIGNSFPVMQNFLRNDLRSRDQIWPVDEVYPGDLGHKFIFESTRDGLQQAIRDKRYCNSPRDAVFATEFKNRFQFFPATFQLPEGWRVAKTLRPVLDTIEFANSWMNEVALCDVSARETARPLQLNFNGTFLGILGEADENALGFRIVIDGKTVPYQTRPASDVWPTSSVPFGGGDRFFWHEISDKLKPGRHTLELYPVFFDGVEKGELRIESICVAGADLDAAQSVSSGAVKFDRWGRD